MAVARHGDVVLLHRLQKRRLRARAGPVDLVGHQQLGEHRAGHETEGAGAIGADIHNLGTKDVRRHQVRSELDARGGETEHGAEGLDELGLGETRHADQEPVPAGEQRDEGAIDDRLLTVDDLADGLAGRRDLGECGLGFGKYLFGVGGCRLRLIECAHEPLVCLEKVAFRYRLSASVAWAALPQ